MNQWSVWMQQIYLIKTTKQSVKRLRKATTEEKKSPQKNEKWCNLTNLHLHGDDADQRIPCFDLLTYFNWHLWRNGISYSNAVQSEPSFGLSPNTLRRRRKSMYPRLFHCPGLGGVKTVHGQAVLRGNLRSTCQKHVISILSFPIGQFMGNHGNPR